MSIGSVIERLARAYLDKERHRLGIPQEEQQALASEDNSLVRRAQAAKIAQDLELRPRELEAEIANRAALTENTKANTESLQSLREAQTEAAKALAGRRENPIDARSLEIRAEEALSKGDTATYERLKRVKKEMGQADDRPRQPSFMLQIPDWVLDKDTNEVVSVTKEERLRNPNRYGQPPTAESRNIDRRQSKSANSLKALDVLGEQLITEKTAIEQRIKGTGMTIEAAFANLPKFRAYQDARRAMAINLAAIMNQGRPTEPDAQAAADIIPDVISDTVESAAIKRAFIQQMLASPDEARDMLVDFKMKYGAKAPTSAPTALSPAIEERLRKLGLPK